MSADKCEVKFYKKIVKVRMVRHMSEGNNIDSFGVSNFYSEKELAGFEEENKFFLRSLAFEVIRQS